ncbi:MATE family efflux transporter [Curvivirga aplysinae]|uniref:MATE family efflux transporter n=1 Tax=Curvivirga aplysinae TaxID=2529852 RepID=UPI001C3FD4C4|nr:MATE family efflux transporter [Curvivirga aplysinae]
MLLRLIQKDPIVIGKAKEEYRKLFKIAFPLCLGHLGHMAIGTTDVLMIGQLSAEALAASAISISIFYTLYLLLTGTIMAITPVASQAIGAGQARTARRAVRQGIWVALTVSAPALFILWHTEFIFEVTGQTESLIAPAKEYMHTYMWMMIPGLIFDALVYFTVALGRPKPILYVTLIGIAANAFFNYCLIFGNLGAPELGLAGAGISSTLVTTLMLLITASIILTRLPYRRYHVFSRIWRPDWELYVKIYRMGLPIGGGMLLEQAMYSVSVLLAGRLGAVEAAAHSIGMAIINIIYMFSMGISDATTSRVGNNFGRKNFMGVQIAGYAGLSLALLCSSLAFVFVLIFAGPITSAFMDDSLPNAELVLALAVKIAIIGMIFEIADAGQLALKGSLHGISDMKVPLYTFILTYTIVGTTTAYLLSHHFNLGVIGIWYGLLTGVLLTAFFLYLRFQYMMRKISYEPR